MFAAKIIQVHRQLLVGFTLVRCQYFTSVLQFGLHSNKPNLMWCSSVHCFFIYTYLMICWYICNVYQYRYFLYIIVPNSHLQLISQIQVLCTVGICERCRQVGIREAPCFVLARSRFCLQGTCSCSAQLACLTHSSSCICCLVVWRRACVLLLKRYFINYVRNGSNFNQKDVEANATKINLLSRIVMWSLGQMSSARLSRFIP